MPYPSPRRGETWHDRAGAQRADKTASAGRHPDRLFDDVTAETRWRARFQAAHLSAPTWAAVSWYPDGAALQVSHTHQGRGSLYRYRLTTAALSSLDTPRSGPTPGSPWWR